MELKVVRKPALYELNNRVVRKPKPKKINTKQFFEVPKTKTKKR